MKTIGIICEYNPFHNGHARQFRLIRERFGADAVIVCLMSGNYVQRGEPALFAKSVRARAAVECGADLVLELPLTYALRSAEGFTEGGVSILDALGCEALCFGCETGDGDRIMETAKALRTERFENALREELTRGISFASAREAALSGIMPTDALRQPNDILAVEYCKALLKRSSRMELFAIQRGGAYHANEANESEPSASYLRAQLLSGGEWKNAVPPAAAALFEAAPRFTMAAGKRAVLARLRTLPEETFAKLPFGSEGLWRRFQRACHEEAGVEAIIEATKSKRYARTRIQRMLLCAYLGLTERDLTDDAPYVRILAFNGRGRQVLKTVTGIPLVNAGATPPDASYYALECRAADLYTLFAADGNSFPCGFEQDSRIFYQDLEKNTCNP